MRIQFLSFSVLAAVLLHSPSAAQRICLQSGRIVGIEKQEPKSQSLCCYNPTEAPLQSDVIDYNISIEAEHTIYVGRYQTWTGYVPWATDELIDVKADKHLIYLKTPSGEEMRLPIVSQKQTWIE